MPAAPQPTPKHFTDEELKQQYGIHLATRLQADGDGKEAKWADIDDDEDDWAPETIEWNDGTKITLSQNDPAAAMLAEEQARAIIEKERQEEENNKAKLAAQQKPTTVVGPNATVLKPRSAVQPKTGGLVLKTPSEKPTLVAKPSAPTPTRSPWAPLPPVDKVPPVEINPPGQLSTTRLQQSDHYGNSAVPPPPAAMEIAADDFTRTRRDNQNGNLGQLYNAQSGQYEPASTGRRGSVRKDQNFRPPSLLQRGAARDQHEPAEPSAAFQTHRNQQDSASWTRRGSSTVSGDSGPQSRRMSMGKGSDMQRIPADLLHQRRDSQHSQVLQSPSTPAHAQLAFPYRGPSPAQQLAPSATQSPALQHSQLSQDARSTAGSPYQSKKSLSDQSAPPPRDDVVAQRQLMKEKRELAIKRKKEEEEREEAAKKERIRLRMEALGLPPLEEKGEPAKIELEKKPTGKREADTAQIGKKEQEQQETSPEPAQISAPAQEGSSSSPRSPPKPPAPDASGVPQQYGMMKLHGASASNIPQPLNERLILEKTRPQVSSQISPPGLEPRVELAEALPSPRVNGVTPKHPDVPIYRAPDATGQNVARDARQQPWNNASRDPHAYTGWSGQVMTREPSASTSVWGPPSHARNLGNGTFDNRNIQSPQSRQQDQFPSPALEPIGPPRHLQRPRESSELRPQETGPSPIVEDFQTIPTFPSDAPPQPASKPELTGPPPSSDAHIVPPQFGASQHCTPPANNVDRPARGSNQQKSSLAAWGNFQATDAEKNRQAVQQHAARMAEEVRLGVRREEAQLPIMNETWRQVKIDDQVGHRQIVGVQKGQNTHGRFVGPQLNGDLQGPTLPASVGLPPFTAGGIGRGSRFFPAAGTGLHPHYHNGARYPQGYRRSSSPPPPEDGSHLHPAYIRDSLRPTVNLPAMKEKPKVKLPPTLTSPAHSPQMTEVRAIPLRATSQPLVNNPSWQDRFNGLLGVKKLSPEKRYVHVVEFSATKVPLYTPPVEISAAVSLPKYNEAVNKTLEVASKAMEDEEALFENREFGSLPAVQIPSQAPEIGWSAVQNPKRNQYRNSRFSREIESTSKDAFLEKEIISNGGVLIFVRMLGMAYPKSVALSRPGSRNGPGPQSTPRSYPGRTPNKAFKPREGQGNHNNNPKYTQQGPVRNVPAGGSPSQARQPSKNHPAWGPRATNAVH